MGGDLDFKEVIRPPLWLMAFVALMLFSIVVAVWAAFTNSAALYTSLACLFALFYFYRSNIHTISISGSNTDAELRVDRAHIELKYLSNPIVLTEAEFLLERTRNFNPAAYPALIFWVSRGIKVQVNDPRDPTPYWLISTKRGEELCALLANRL